MKQAGIGRPSTYVSTVSKLVDRGYVSKDGSSLIPTDNGRTLWIDVAPYYNNSTDYGDGLFSSEFTSIMEQKLDLIEIGNNDASETWEEFVTIFGDMHNFALEKRRLTPTVRQLQYLERATSQMSEDDKNTILKGKNPDEMTGDEAKAAIENISNSDSAQLPPSEKQLALVIRLIDKLQLDLGSILNERGFSDISELSGGRGGSASELISFLIEMDNDSPATEKQKTTIESMAESVGISVAESMEIVKAETIETISKADASELISNLKKRIKSKPRRKR